MPSLADLTAHLNTTLRIAELPDYSNAVNGLQLENRSGQVTRIAAAVDATLPVVKKAIATRADLLIVHHGMHCLQGVADKAAALCFTELPRFLEH